MPGTLVFPPRLTASAERVREAAIRRGVTTAQFPTFEVPEDMVADHVHAGPPFADAVAPHLGIALLEAPATWLPDLPLEFTRRTITAMSIADAW
ncbi:hypothetical protein ACFT2C_03145 [Promicromonospora sp. NPDC057138]|uniref:hypothetical protein n=1 Tax=Promicromonospora sp. NPDC057138 TaxID=3346031 RepID=UPI0036329A20